MIEIFVDGDGCPVKDEVYVVSTRYGLPVALVALAEGAGLATVALIGVVSEAAGLVVGLAAMHGDYRRSLPLPQASMGTS